MSETDDGGGRAFAFGGMTMRDWFAGQALAPLVSETLSLPKTELAMAEYWQHVAEAAYVAADAMLGQRAKKKDGIP